MKLSITDVGPINNGNINLDDDLIILCGSNNTGKTYIAYVIFGLYKYAWSFKSPSRFFNSSFDDLLNNGVMKLNLLELFSEGIQKFIDQISKKFIEELPNVFSTDESSGFFVNSKIGIDTSGVDLNQKALDVSINTRLKLGKYVFQFEKIKGDKYLNIVMIEEEDGLSDNSPNSLPSEIVKHILNVEIVHLAARIIFNNVYIAPAERIAINLFSKELSIRRNEIVEELLEYKQQKSRYSTFDLLSKRTKRYSLPIREALEIAEDLSVLQGKSSEYRHLADAIEKEILRGKVRVSKEGEVTFAPNRINKNLGIHLSASIVKSLASIVFYLRHLAKPNDFIIIDEPELNLHPDNQRKIARLLARCVNAGFKILISTHSDYIIREFNNLIMLNNNNKVVAKSLMSEFGYKSNELLDFQKIGAYLIKDGVCEHIEIEKNGFSITSIDDEINSLNNSSEKIYYKLYQ